MKTRSFFITLLLAIQLPLLSQSSLTDSIDHFIQKKLTQYSEIPGLAITIVKGDKDILTKAYGYSDVEHKIPSTLNTPYYIASVTKSFLGVLAAQLDQEGILDLETPITDYEPIKSFNDQSLFQNVSIQDLLSHTSGIANVPLGWQYSNSGEYSEKQLISLLEHETISRQNNKSHVYDNFGYHVFELILSKEFDINWKHLLKEKIFTPLGMSHSSASILYSSGQNSSVAKPYTGLNDDRGPQLNHLQKNNYTMHAAGGIVSSIGDMKKWLIANMNTGNINSQQVLSSEALTKAHSKITNVRANSGRLFQDSGYGLGWNIGLFGKKEVLYHSGGYDGYYALTSYMPEANTGISILVNETHFGDNIGNLIVSFAYDLLSGEITSAEEYVQNEKRVAQQVNGLQRAFAADRARRKKRPWKITRTIERFSGNYHNKQFGNMKVELIDKQPVLSIGISKSIGTQSSIEDALRVEFRDGRGEDILFIFDGKKPHALIYKNRVFYRK